MPNRLVSEIPAGPPGVVQGTSVGRVWVERFSMPGKRLSG